MTQMILLRFQSEMKVGNWQRYLDNFEIAQQMAFYSTVPALYIRLHLVRLRDYVFAPA